MYWYDGQAIDSAQLQLNVNDPGLCYGATVFTTMRVYERSLEHYLTNWLAHGDRLQATVKVFGWQQPDWQQLKSGAELLSQKYQVLRLTLFPDGREWITGRNLPSDLKQRQLKGITAWVAPEPLYRRDLPQYKTGNYLAAYLARHQALKINAQEAILIDSQGNWLETSTGNLWGQKQDCWYTPSLDSGILPGIARSRWLNYFLKRKIKVKESIWTPQFVSTLESLSYSNCVVDWIPIKKVLDLERQINFALKQPFPID